MKSKKESNNDIIITNFLNELFKKNLTQAELAKTMGITPQTISPYLTGKRKFGQNMLKKLAHALDIPVEQLLRQPDEPIARRPEPEKKELSQAMQTVIKEFTTDEGSFMMILIKK